MALIFDLPEAEGTYGLSSPTDNFDRNAYYGEKLQKLANSEQMVDGIYFCAAGGDDKVKADDKPADKGGDKPKERPKDVPQKTIDDYIQSFENLHKNGACNKETLDAFKETVKSLPTMDAKGLEAALKKAIGNNKVNTALVMQHIREILKASGYIQIDGGAEDKADEGGLFMKHPTTEVYVYMVYRREKGKSDARVEVDRKKD